MKTYVNDTGMVVVWLNNNQYVTIYCDSYELVHCKTGQGKIEMAYRFLDKNGNEIVHLWAYFVDTIWN